MRTRRKIIEIDAERCDGCGQCVPSCAEGAIQVVDGRAMLVADDFDEEAVFENRRLTSRMGMNYLFM